MADVEINLARESGSLSNSPVTIGDIAGGNISKTNTSSAPNEQTNLQQAINQQLLSRLIEVERVLGGQWGQPGLVQNVATIKEKIFEIEESRQDKDNKLLLLNIEREMAKSRQDERLIIEREKRYATVYLVVATLCLALSFGIVLRWF